jgi:acyl carrier protein
MKPTKGGLLDIIYHSLEEVNEQLPNDAQIQKSPEATLVGQGGGLDSLGFVNFIALVEEECAHKYGITVSLMDGVSDEDATLEDVGSFADWLFQRLTTGTPQEVQRNVLKSGLDAALE